MPETTEDVHNQTQVDAEEPVSDAEPKNAAGNGEEIQNGAMEDVNQPPSDQNDLVMQRIMDNLQQICGLVQQVYSESQALQNAHKEKTAQLGAELEEQQRLNDHEERNLEAANHHFHHSWKQIAANYAPSVLKEDAMNE